MAKAATAAPSGKKEKKGAKKKEKRVVPHGVAHIQASFNNTIVSIADPEGNVLAWSSAGRIGFKGSRKGTPFAAQVAAQNAGNLAKDLGVRTVEVEVEGPGSGASRRSAPWRRRESRSSRSTTSPRSRTTAAARASGGESDDARRDRATARRARERRPRGS